ncbi:pyridoxal phosphate-dependent aminotransferase [Sphingosinicella rhizophila]
MAVAKLAYALQAEGRSVIHMEFGQPSTGAPSAAIAKAHEMLDKDTLGYWESPKLRERIAHFYREREGIAVDPDAILLTCGASPALILALATAFRPGATVALARPGYVAYRNGLKTLHINPLELECEEAARFQLSADMIAALDPAPEGVIVASPANPTGTIIPPDELKALAEVCRDRKIRILSDEIYHGLSYGAPTHSILRYDESAFVINSFSKYFSMPGWRLGWLVVPDDHLEGAKARMGNMFLTPPSLSQHAALAAFDCRDELEANIDTYRRNRELLLEALPGLGLGNIAPPDGAFYVYVSVGHLTNDSLSFCEKLLRDTGVAITPGLDFDPVDGHRFVRMSFAVSTELVKEAIERLRVWLPTMGPNAQG